ncbi:MAG: ABC transporter permease [Bacteroidales bacterium]|nr:ABC transporter permease [Bacteroidales bacterium]
MRDLFKETWESIKRNKLRTCLTGLAVSWGLLMLITLLGAGNGIKNSFMSDMEGNSSDLMTIYGQWTSKPYDGLKEDRRIILSTKDKDALEGNEFSGKISNVMTRISASGTITYGTKYSSSSLLGCYPGYYQSLHRQIMHGRFINNTDIRESRKTIVLSSNLADILTDGKPLNGLIGKRVKIEGLAYTVVGIIKNDEMDDSRIGYIPEPTLRTIYQKGVNSDNITFNFHDINSEQENDEFEAGVRKMLNVRHRAAPDDDRALWISNSFRQNLMMNRASRILNVALWIIGLFTLLGGIVGVSNIMLITVKERTHEFGIRKAIGASPMQIVKLIIAESITITAVFGYIGMFLGMVVCSFLDYRFSGNTQEVLGMQFKIMENPTVGMDVALEATLLLIIAGTIAGLIPAMKAAKVKPIEALMS